MGPPHALQEPLGGQQVVLSNLPFAAEELPAPPYATFLWLWLFLLPLRNVERILLYLLVSVEFLQEFSLLVWCFILKLLAVLEQPLILLLGSELLLKLLEAVV